MRKKGFKEERACMALLRTIQASGALDPRQTETLDRAIALLQDRKQHGARGRQVVFRAVRVIAQTLWEAFSGGQGRTGSGAGKGDS